MKFLRMTCQNKLKSGVRTVLILGIKPATHKKEISGEKLSSRARRRLRQSSSFFIQRGEHPSIAPSAEYTKTKLGLFSILNHIG
jgi:hypothetical protein